MLEQPRNVVLEQPIGPRAAQSRPAASAVAEATALPSRAAPVALMVFGGIVGTVGAGLLE